MAVTLDWTTATFSEKNRNNFEKTSTPGIPYRIIFTISGSVADT
jgi:hypothetical protein